MPELPEVESYRAYFVRHALGQRIARVEIRDARALGEIRPEAFVTRVKGRAFTRVRRHGKHLFAGMEPRERKRESWLHLHFGMSGDLAYYARAEEAPRFARIVFAFVGGGHLAFEDMRLFGVADLVSDPDTWIGEHGLGPDPLDEAFGAAEFAARLGERRGAVKAVLLSQNVIAGIGNLYADELLFQSGIDPRRAMAEIDARELRSAYTAMRRVLRVAVAKRIAGDELPAAYLYHHREEGARCPRCGGTIRRSVVGGRTTYSCGRHQR